MPPTFYFAIGARPRRRDLDVALAAQQRHFLVPVGSSAIPWLRHQPGVHVALDSAAWPPDNPNRPTLAAYAQAILAWRLPDGSWGNLDWAATYDHIGNPVATRRDHTRLLALLDRAGAGDAPIVASLQYPECASTLVDSQPPTRTSLGRPTIALGGLVPHLSPTQPRAVFEQASGWFDDVLRDLAPDARLHLFGIGRPGFALRSPCVVSIDSSGPVQMASYGWQKIAPHYTPAYGLSAEKLQTSREARLAFWLITKAAQLGLPWQPVDESDLLDDRSPAPWVQLSLDSLLAA